MRTLAEDRRRKARRRAELTAEGLCIACQQPRDCDSIQLCAVCLLAQRLYVRARLGCQPRRVARILTAVCVALTLSAIAVAQTTPTLTEVETLKLELLQTKTVLAQVTAQYDSCKAEVGAVFDALGRLRARAAEQALTAEEAQLTDAIEATHPGWTFNPKTKQFTPKAGK